MTEPPRPDVGRLHLRWSEVARAFAEVADTCIPTGDPMQTATALRKAATILSSAADEFEIMYQGMIQGE